MELKILNSNNEEILNISTPTTSLIFSLNTKHYPNGTYTINAKAYDGVNNLSEKTIIITILNEDEKPQMMLTNFTDGVKVSGVLETKIFVSDDYGITKIEFYINNQLVDTYTTFSTYVVYSFNYNTQLLSNGLYELKIITYDTSGQILLKLLSLL